MKKMSKKPETLEDMKRLLAQKRAETDRLVSDAESKLDDAEKAIEEREKSDQGGG